MISNFGADAKLLPPDVKHPHCQTQNKTQISRSDVLNYSKNVQYRHWKGGLIVCGVVLMSYN